VPAERNSLQAVLDRQTQAAPPPVAKARPARAEAAARVHQPEAGKFFRPSREGRRLIAGHFDPKVAKQLKLLAAEEDTTVQALLEEALELLFLKKGQGAIRNV
jgi:hypothetical protein